MAVGLKLGADGDLELVDGRLQLLTDPVELVIQRLLIRLNTHLGEWMLDTTFGVDYLGSILTADANAAVVRAVFAEAITSCPGVAALTSLRFRLEDRSLFVSFDVLVENKVVEVTASSSDFPSVLLALKSARVHIVGQGSILGMPVVR